VSEAPAADPRCGYPKKDGSPCRNRVAAEGKVCRVHQKAALLDRLLSKSKADSGRSTSAADGEADDDMGAASP
jgi:hypothetical protein